MIREKDVEYVIIPITSEDFLILLSNFFIILLTILFTNVHRNLQKKVSSSHQTIRS